MALHTGLSMVMNSVDLDDPKPPWLRSAESRIAERRKELQEGRKWEDFNKNLGPPPVPLELPENAELIFLNEGAANIVYKIHVPSSPSEKFSKGTVDDEKNPWEGKLLRLRKYLPTTRPAEKAYQEFRSRILPLFPPGYLIDIDLVSIKQCGIIKRLNRELRQWENGMSEMDGFRLNIRHGIYLADDDYGLLITDMTPPPNTTLIQFKPKWLTPPYERDVSRCRTCALTAFRNYIRVNSEPPQAPIRSFCPLELLGGLSDATVRTILDIPEDEEKHTSAQATLKGRLGKWLEEGQPILKILRPKQRTLDPAGVLDIVNCDGREGERQKRLEDLQIAMTLRDVTLFLQIPHDDEQPIVARLGDLDVKSLEKLDSWVKIERQLREEEWYEGRFEDQHECSYDPEYHAEDVNWSEKSEERGKRWVGQFKEDEDHDEDQEEDESGSEDTKVDPQELIDLLHDKAEAEELKRKTMELKADTDSSDDEVQMLDTRME